MYPVLCVRKFQFGGLVHSLNIGKRFFATLLLTLIPHFCYAEKIIFYYTEAMPFIGRSAEGEIGFHADIIKEVFSKQGYEIDFRMIPLGRAVAQLKRGIGHAIAAVGKDDISELEKTNTQKTFQSFEFPEEELGSIHNTFFVNKNSRWSYRGLDSLKPIKLVTTEEYIHSPYLESYEKEYPDNILGLYGEKQIERATKILVSGRAQVLLGSRPAIRWVASKIPNVKNTLLEKGDIGPEKKLYVAFSNSHPRAKEFAEIMSNGIIQLRTTGELGNILKQYNQRDWKPIKHKNQNSYLVIGYEQGIHDLDPTKKWHGFERSILNNIYEGLLTTENNSLDFKPVLATRWEVSDDSNEWMFFLREGVTFHDGTPFNATVAAYNLRRYFNRNHPGSETNKTSAIIFDHVESIDVISEFIVRIKLKETYAPFLGELTSLNTKFISMAALNKKNSNVSESPVGTGPYRFVQGRKGYVTLKGNPKYWGDPPYLGELRFRQYSEKELLENLSQGNIDVIGDDIIAYNDTVPSMKGIDPHYVDILSTTYLAINNSKKPLDQIKIREAIHHAINRKSIISKALKGAAIPAKTIIPPAMWGHDARISELDYDPAKARRLLKEAGLEDGFSVSLKFNNSDTAVEICTVIKNDLEKVGVRVKLIRAGVDRKHWQRLNAGDYELALVGRQYYVGDPDELLYSLFVKKEIDLSSHVQEEGSDLVRKIIQARTTFGRDQRVQHYHAAQNIIRENLPIVFLYHGQKYTARASYVRDLVYSLNGEIRFHKTWIE
jgi:peptide/nickel transport system substrate-binding protein